MAKDETGYCPEGECDCFEPCETTAEEVRRLENEPHEVGDFDCCMVPTAKGETLVDELLASDGPQAAIIEIVQRQDATNTMAGGIIIPQKVRVNGHEILMPNDEPVRVESIAVGDGEPAIVQLRVFARLVVIGTESDCAAMAEGLRS